MLRIFNRLRQNANGTHSGRYLIYAVGEIILVMVGILLALQVNNWNENRKERIEESKLLTEIYEQLKDDTIRINRNIKLFSYFEFSKFIANTDAYFELSKYYRTNIYPKFFKFYSYGYRCIPVDYEKLKTENQFKIALDYSLNDSRFYKSRLQRKKSYAVMLVSALSEKIKTTEFEEIKSN
jgi:hypothetical protein